MCMYASIHIRFFLCLVLNSNNFGRFQIYFKPIRCSLETKHFLRVLRPLKPPLGSQNTPEPPAPLTFVTLTFPPIVFTPGVMSDICMYGTQLKKTSNAYTFFFFKKKQTCLKNVDEFRCITNDGKTAKNEWGNDDSDSLPALYIL